MIKYVAGWLILAWLLHWIGIPPTNYYRLGNWLYQQGKFQLAETAYQKSFVDPQLAGPAYFNAGNAAFRLGKYSMAIQYYEMALEHFPEDADTWYNLELARRRLAESSVRSKASSAGLSGHTLSAEPALSPSKTLTTPSAGSSHTWQHLNPARNYSESTIQQLLQHAQEQEQHYLAMYSAGERKDRSLTSPPDLFTLPPLMLLEYVREQTRAGYPFRPGSSLIEKHRTQEVIDW